MAKQIIDIEFTGQDGTKQDRKIGINKMGAMEGWEIQRRFIEFAMSKDKTFRVAYTMEVLAHAEVIRGETILPITSPALIENHLGNWHNIQKVFNSVLVENGIDPNTHAEKEHYWAHAGGEMAAAFIEQTITLLGPLMKGREEQKE